jgi:Peptidase family C25
MNAAPRQPGTRPIRPISRGFSVNSATARALFFATLAALAFGLLGGRASLPQPPECDVFLAGKLSDEALVALSAAVMSHEPPALLLIDSPEATPYTRAFLATYSPKRVCPIGCFGEGRTGLEQRLDVRMAPAVPWDNWMPDQVLKLCAHTDAAIVCPPRPRGRLLQAACLAGSLQVPLLTASDSAADAASLSRCVQTMRMNRLTVVGTCPQIPGVAVDALPDASAVAATRQRELVRCKRATTVVVANPADDGAELGAMSVLAPLVALQKHAPLLLTNAAGDDAEAVVLSASRESGSGDIDAVVLVANLKAVPMTRRPNPLPKDKDPVIEMEPLTPDGAEPFSFATGRLFHEDRAVLPLLLARQQLLARAPGPRRALVASNPRGDMSLLEAFSRNTVHELRNAGYETTALFGKQVNGDDLRRLLPEHDVFLWEGHHNPLIVDYGFAGWDEPLPPSLVFLQSCLALKEGKAGPLLSRGAVGVVGSSTRTYSASGGACSLAFFNAILYDRETLGGALRQAKNFLLAYSLLKEKRLGKDATRTGANLRSAWAFTLWGDPTLQLPGPTAPPDALPGVRHEVQGNTIVLFLPAEKHERVTSDKYRAEMMPNARLAGLVRKEKGSEGLSLAPFVFAEVRLTDAEPGRVPRLRSRLPDDRYVFCWDGRRGCGYLLVTPGPRPERELRFRVEWQASSAVKAAAAPRRDPS